MVFTILMNQPMLAAALCISAMVKEGLISTRDFVTYEKPSSIKNWVMLPYKN